MIGTESRDGLYELIANVWDGVVFLAKRGAM